MKSAATLKTRFVMIPIVVFTGKSYGAWRDWFFATTKPTVSSGKSCIDWVAFLTFQFQVYGLTLWTVGADVTDIATLFASIAFLMTIIVRPIGLLIQVMRSLVGVGVKINASIATKSHQSCL
ncbi:MAG: L-alanine exporter AlaE [Ascidiaceihabitans sp.]|uniref:L-alanine exporter AlaE n=1 Tax=Ascidiaceihabitans sp. TaxID=1872644 RepID=UPI0032991BF5